MYKYVLYNLLRIMWSTLTISDQSLEITDVATVGVRSVVPVSVMFCNLQSSKFLKHQ